MSFNRISPEAGRKNPRTLPKGPNGRTLCRWCGKETKPPRRTFCSDACVHEHRIRSDPGYLRETIFRRDSGVCAACGFEAGRYEQELRTLHKTLLKTAYRSERYQTLFGRIEELVNTLQPRGYPCSLGYGGLRLTTFWNADHIIPVSQGGGECTVENIRTLCVPCHAKETAALRKVKSSKSKQKPCKTTDPAAPPPKKTLSSKPCASSKSSSKKKRTSSRSTTPKSKS